LLELDPGSPILEVERVAYSITQVPVEYRIMHINTERYEYLAGTWKDEAL
jgi:GntR family transcriptional regulator